MCALPRGGAVKRALLRKVLMRIVNKLLAPLPIAAYRQIFRFVVLMREHANNTAITTKRI